jgi:hypothetical protein
MVDEVNREPCPAVDLKQKPWMMMPCERKTMKRVAYEMRSNIIIFDRPEKKQPTRFYSRGNDGLPSRQHWAASLGAAT